jgi:transposase
MIGPINLGMKRTGERSAGNRPAAFDVAGAGNVTRAAGLRSTAKVVGKPPEPTVRAPVLYLRGLGTGNRLRLPDTQRMTGNPCWQAIPTKLSETQFEEFVLPHLSRGRRGPPPTLSLHKIFNYILKALYMGCQWMMLPIESNDKGRLEIHHTRVYRVMRRWQADGSIERIFSGTVDRLQLSVIHGDGTTTAAKKGGDNLGYSGHKQLKGCKVVYVTGPAT